MATVKSRSVLCGDYLEPWNARDNYMRPSVPQWVGRGARLAQASLSPMLEGEGLIPSRDVGCSPLTCDTD